MLSLNSKYANFFIFLFLAYGLSFVPSQSVSADDKIIPNFKIGYIPIVDHLILGVAKKREGDDLKSFNLDPIRFPDMGTVAEGIRSGDLDGGFLLAPLAFQAKLKGAKIKILALGHRNGSAFVVRVKPGIDSVKDLRDKTIAIPHRFSTHNMLLHMFTSKEGLIPNRDFKVIELGPTEMPSALAGGVIDGYIVAEPIAARSEVLGVGKVLVLSKDIWKDHPDCVLVMGEDVISKFPQAVEEFLESLVRAGIYAEVNREESSEIGSKFLGQPIEALKISMMKPKDRVTFVNLIPEVNELSRIQDYMANEMNLFPKKVDLNSFIDASFIRTAYDNLESANKK